MLSCLATDSDMTPVGKRSRRRGRCRSPFKTALRHFCSLLHLRNRRHALLNKFSCNIIGRNISEHVRQHHRMGQHTVLSRDSVCATWLSVRHEADVHERELIRIVGNTQPRFEQVTLQTCIMNELNEIFELAPKLPCV